MLALAVFSYASGDRGVPFLSLAVHPFKGMCMATFGCMVGHIVTPSTTTSIFTVNFKSSKAYFGSSWAASTHICSSREGFWPIVRFASGLSIRNRPTSNLKGRLTQSLEILDLLDSRVNQSDPASGLHCEAGILGLCARHDQSLDLSNHINLLITHFN